MDEEETMMSEIREPLKGLDVLILSPTDWPSW